MIPPLLTTRIHAHAGETGNSSGLEELSDMKKHKVNTRVEIIAIKPNATVESVATQLCSEMTGNSVRLTTTYVITFRMPAYQEQDSRTCVCKNFTSPHLPIFLSFQLSHSQNGENFSFVQKAMETLLTPVFF